MENQEIFLEKLLFDLSKFKEKNLKDIESANLIQEIETLITEYKKKRIAAHVYGLNYGEKVRKIRNLETTNKYLREFINDKGYTPEEVNKFIFKKIKLLEE